MFCKTPLFLWLKVSRTKQPGPVLATKTASSGHSAAPADRSPEGFPQHPPQRRVGGGTGAAARRRRGRQGLASARRPDAVTSERKRTLREAAQNPAVTGISVAPRTLVSFAPGSGCVGRACSSLRRWRPGLTRQRPLPPPLHRPPRARAVPAPGRRPRRRPRREGF